MRDELAHFVEAATLPVAELDIRDSKLRHKQFEVRDLTVKTSGWESR